VADRTIASSRAIWESFLHDCSIDRSRHVFRPHGSLQIGVDRSGPGG
jgi:hypothetical protein